MEVKMVLLVILALAAFAAFCVYQNRKRRAEIMAKIRRTWGERPVRQYTGAEFDAIGRYFEKKGREGSYIDDITWNDLDMDTIFMLLNHTWSCIGESYLYFLLRRLSFSTEELEERERIVRYFAEHGSEREQMEYFFAKIGKTGARSIFDYIYNLADYEEDSKTVHYLGIGAFLFSLAALAAAPAVGIIMLVASVSFCWATYSARRRKIEPYVMSCKCLLEMLRAADELQKVKLPAIQEYQENIAKARKRFDKFKRNSFFVLAGASTSAGGGIEESLALYINFTFHIDLIQFGTLVRELKENMDAFESLTENIGRLESAVAIASFREMMEEWSVPELERTSSVYLRTENVYHPMIDEPVKNSISVERGVLLTGSNASGKSTFLKTIAINALLAQTIHTVLADSWKSNFCQIYSSMALRDDLMSQESYYIVEIKSLKRILDHMEDEMPLLCFVDEVLRGTNTVERIAASAQILRGMDRENVMCFAATHDIELTYMLEKQYENFHFQEEVKENDILFNYCLYEGRATSRNAIRLLSIIGYDTEIIEAAEASAERFMESGEWV
ncbi:MAG: hypothetical protein HFI80_05470 [Lachnospiraceae bacterium]|jgi:energy-coupling factor transporter ATP-binding protein EcfA2|uniref:MutS-related protein n=1 Tax=Hominisplanchenecus murintestinalis TaxID=2941517 RepID=UPI000EA3356D|nr:hypothetical protein [Hominisplanchenecus murintestinalis]MCI9516504.1 hypothetical protein [Lachnospiraceae bacterium]RKJ95327.1 hypothetical protein D7Y41_10825 [Anaerotruncus sp. 1XD22-93]MCI9660983.1 hypothetical protein [Lachnospiraceae bacterium]NBH97773.1 hypothetical protein [Lachnospiraceae bacterium]NBI74911.1 hypothetical protein [Lachnospiraceae bacterium]